VSALLEKDLQVPNWTSAFFFLGRSGYRLPAARPEQQHQRVNLILLTKW